MCLAQGYNTVTSVLTGSANFVNNRLLYLVLKLKRNTESCVMVALYVWFTLSIMIHCILGGLSLTVQFLYYTMVGMDRVRSEYSKTCVKRPLKNRQNKDLYDKL